MPSFCIQLTKDTSLMTVIYRSSCRVSYLWHQKSLNSVVSSIHNDSHHTSSAIHDNNHRGNDKPPADNDTCPSWFLRAIRERDSTQYYTLLCELIWDRGSSVSIFLLGGRRAMERSLQLEVASGQQNQTTIRVAVKEYRKLLFWPGTGKVKNKEVKEPHLFPELLLD